MVFVQDLQYFFQCDFVNFCMQFFCDVASKTTELQLDLITFLCKVL